MAFDIFLLSANSMKNAHYTPVYKLISFQDGEVYSAVVSSFLFGETIEKQLKDRNKSTKVTQLLLCMYFI